MKIFLAAGALALALTGPALAQADMKMGEMAGMKHDAPVAAKTADGQGVIKGIDAAGGTVTLQHQPIPALKWPAMTMKFKAAPALLKPFKVGQAVTFKLKPMGASAEVVAMSAK
ncbi:copper-binding protein [Caulobacter sp. DWR2-3-1b2]|uniref:copper-binding protein n=1 Tax=unclassified Caulobacter TaxID=2648921 RepID=UPI003CE97384